MSYEYKDLRSKLFTEDGSVLFLEIRDRVQRLLKASGAVTAGRAMAGSTGDSWMMLACVDRMVELNELRELAVLHECAGQDRVFVAVRAR